MSNQDQDSRLSGSGTTAVSGSTTPEQQPASVSASSPKVDPTSQRVQEAKALKEQAAAEEARRKAGIGVYGRAPQVEKAQYIDPNGDYYKPWVQSYSQGVPEFVDTHQFENLVELFAQTVKEHGHAPAYVNMGTTLTYNEVNEQVQRFAAFLQGELGLGPGDKIAIMLPNLLQFPIALFGALRAGLTVTNVNPLYTPREIKGQLENSDAVALVVIANFAYHVASIIKETKVQHVIVTQVGDCLGGLFNFKRRLVNAVVRYKGMVPKYDHHAFVHEYSWNWVQRRGKSLLPSFAVPHIHYDDIALLQYTGGTTGRSKGAMLSHGNIIANIAQAMGMYHAVLKGEQETILTVIPLYHIFALTVNLMLFTYLGAKNLFITNPRDLKSFSRDLHEHPEITAITGVNTLFNLFLNHKEFQDLKWENLHLVVGGGAAVQSGVEERFYRKTGFHILEGYGLTECSPLCAVCPYDVEGYTGSIGLIVPSTIARIVDADGNEIRNLQDEGELEIKGPQVMHGYYKSDDNNDIFDEGYVRTGDIAKWMPGGYIKLIDRLKDMILVSGFNVFPNEIEDVVSRFNRVLECAVIGIPSDHTGEAVKLYAVKRDPALTALELKQYCRAYLTPYKVPRVVQFVDALPKSSLGKILRRRLRDLERQNQLNAEDQLLLLKAGFDPTAADANAKLFMLKKQAEKDAAAEAQIMSAAAAAARQDINAPAASAMAVAAAEATAGDEGKAAATTAPAPQKKSAGALALERLMSSKEGLDAAIATPNIHHTFATSKLVSSATDLREHLAAAKAQSAANVAATANARSATKPPQKASATAAYQAAAAVAAAEEASTTPVAAAPAPTETAAPATDTAAADAAAVADTAATTDTAESKQPPQ